MKLGKTLHAKDRKQWAAWLARHHRTAPEIWLVYYRKETGKPRIPYPEAVEEALRYGWIDSIQKKVDDERLAQRYSPRRPGSKLSPLNLERVRRLVAEGKMTPFGLEQIRHAYDPKRDRKRTTLPKDLEKALRADPEVWKNFQRFPAAYRRIRIGWIDGVRDRPEEFKKRLRYFLRMTRANKRYGMER